ncbi:MAG: alpha-ketoacid dehydrogenase subunit beta [Alphaproteobacteria bacterium]|nr:alpha-ketoacid dehydrogenase subunit beta [Alphaproteobacteria bacterium]
MTDTRTLTYVNALNEGMRQAMREDERVFLFGLDVDDHKAIQGSTKGLVEEFGAERVFTTPLSEDAMTGLAIGAAVSGMRPIHTHIRMDFLMLGMNQLVNMASKYHYMYGGAASVPMVVRSMIGKSWGQGAQHSQGLHALFMHIPGLKVVAPSNAHDAKGLMIAAVRDNNPVMFVEHRLLYPTEAFVEEAPFEVPFGKARVIREGGDVTLVGVSNMVNECLRAAELLQEEGIEATVLDPVSLIPLDYDRIARETDKTGNLIVVDNGWTCCGASAEILADLAERGTRAKMKRMGFAPTTCPTSPALEALFYPNPATIAQAAHEMLRPGKTYSPDPERAKLAYQVAFKGPF